MVAVGLGELRNWVDKRVEDLYPVEVAERMSLFVIGVCDPEKVSRLSMESKNSAEKFRFLSHSGTSMTVACEKTIHQQTRISVSICFLSFLLSLQHL
ncbi:hypothetical protein NC651_010708 [Populus alba x Populus x berolinensis]|nr:hypothetical protein NC651_010708 [Populus alba x Populus x berolinensis]